MHRFRLHGLAVGQLSRSIRAKHYKPWPLWIGRQAMTDAILAFLIGGCLISIALILWLLWHRREPPPEPMEYTEPRVFTRIWDGNANSTKEN